MVARNNVWKRWSIIAGWITLVLFGIGLDIHYLTTPPNTMFELTAIGGDFGMYYTAARSLLANPHANIYQLATLHANYVGGCGGPPATTYPYQPFLALLLEPLTILPCTPALYVWWQLSFLLWGIVTFWFARDATRNYGPGRGLLVGAVCVFYVPIWNGLDFGQVHVLVLFLIVLASRLAAVKRLGAAGGWLAVGVFLKYFPVFLVAYHVVKGRWRVAIGAALVGMALLLSELLIVGPGTLVASIAGASSDVAAYSKVRQDWLSFIPGETLLIRLLAVLTFVTILAVTWRKRKDDEGLGEGWALCAMLLIAPLAWYHYLTWLLPALIALLHFALDRTRDIRPGFSAEAITRRLPLVGFALSLGLILMLAQAFTGPVILFVWVVCGASYLASAGVFADMKRYVQSIGPETLVGRRIAQ